MRLEYLDWDSSSFGFKVGQIVFEDYFFENELNYLLDKAIQEKYKLIYVFIPENKEILSNTLKKRNGKLVDRKIIYKIDLRDKAIQEENKNIFDWTGEPLTNELLLLTYSSGQFSRFLLDKQLPKNVFQSMYKEWIEKSLSGELADKVYVAVEKEKVIGFVTVKISVNKIGEIGLIAIEKNAQGKNIGTKLIHKCFNYLRNNNIRKLLVPTQLDNIKACKFYEKNGFSKYLVTNIYHFWS